MRKLGTALCSVAVYGKVNGGSIGAAAHVAKNLATLKVELARSGY